MILNRPEHEKNRPKPKLKKNSNIYLGPNVYDPKNPDKKEPIWISEYPDLLSHYILCVFHKSLFVKLI